MGLLKKLIVGLVLLVLIGAIAVYGIQYYYSTPTTGFLWGETRAATS
ncbi:hypothetical protein GQS_08325 [Thermococcus sp. 4557]|nr:hypothetical protein [Thermococcus sp. 4557]AEK73559.1 hypothetical protein GQS_08325 [Thermococcus sp. 4557]